MVKKKKSKQSIVQSLSPERFMREKVRGLEIGTCYVSDDIWKEGGGIVAVTRMHKGGKRTVGYFLVDVFCLGVKKAGFHVRLDDMEFDDLMETFDDMEIREASYGEVHNIIYGAIAFAEEAGIRPCKEFALARYVLEEDTDDIPLIEYQYGKDGMHCLIAENQLEASRYLPLLSKNLGEGNYRFVVSSGWGEGYPQKYDRKANESNVRKWEQSYTYTPSNSSLVQLNTVNKRVWEILSQNEHYILTDREVDELLAVPHDELRHDTLNILEHAIGVWWNTKDADDFLYYPAVGHALMLLGEVGNEDDLDIVLEVMRMPKDFLERVFGDVSNLIVQPTIFRLGQNRLDKLMDFMKETGIEIFYKSDIEQAVLHVGLDLDRRGEAVDWYRRLLTDILADFPNATYTDTMLNGFIVGSLMELDAREALPDIKRLFDICFIDLEIDGVYNDVVADMGNLHECPIDMDIKHRFKDMRMMTGD